MCLDAGLGLMRVLRRESADRLLMRARRGALVLALTMLAASATLLTGCSGDTEEPAEPTQAAPSPAPAAATSAPAATPTQAPAVETPTAAPTATPPPRPTPSNLAAELPTDPNFPELSQIVLNHLSGMNNINRPRLNLPPDIRDDRRRGGIVINIEFNGDEYDTTTQKKAELDILMRDTYEVIFTSGHDVAEVTMTAVMIGTIRRSVGGTAEGPISVYKTRFKRDYAEGLDWSDKENIDFNEVWDTLTLNPAWKRDLQEGN